MDIKLRWSTEEGRWIVQVLRDGVADYEISLDDWHRLHEKLEAATAADPALPQGQWRLPLRQH